MSKKPYQLLQVKKDLILHLEKVTTACIPGKTDDERIYRLFQYVYAHPGSWSHHQMFEVLTDSIEVFY
jgi:hypothetical protein